MNPLSKIQSKECFISHCSADAAIMKSFSDLMNRYFDTISSLTIFNTFDENHTTKAGDERADAIKKHLQKSSVMIAMITDSYLRSTICISELSAFWYSSKRVIPIVFNGETGRNFLFDIFGRDIIYIDTDTDPKACTSSFFDSLRQAGIVINDPDLRISAKKAFCSFFKNSFQTKSGRKFIGMSDEYTNILSYCNEFGVHRFKNSRMDSDELKKKLSDKSEIIILSTTGAGLVSSLSEFLPEAVKRGTDVTLLLPNRYSDYTIDVAEIEMPDSPGVNLDRLNEEFNTVMRELCIAAKKAHAGKNADSGHIYVGCSFTLLRQTIILGKKEDEVWGWASVTIPPKKTKEGTPSLEFSGSVSEKTMAKIMYEHLTGIRNMAQKRPFSWYEVLPDTDPATLSFGSEKIPARKEWQELYDRAKQNTEKHYSPYSTYSDILIEVAAQHPLTKDGKPGIEFQRRLDQALSLYQKLSADGTEVHIYVPGSRHKFEGHADPVSLSFAGTTYLRENGIPEEHLLGEEKNEKYKGSLGVYNSADECYVASKIFFDGSYKQLYCICSPNQMVRKHLFYIAFGILPMLITVPCEEMFHDPLYELFEAIPNIVLKDHTWQGEDSPEGIRTRKERIPDDMK